MWPSPLPPRFPQLCVQCWTQEDAVLARDPGILGLGPVGSQDVPLGRARQASALGILTLETESWAWGRGPKTGRCHALVGRSPQNSPSTAFSGVKPCTECDLMGHLGSRPRTEVQRQAPRGRADLRDKATCIQWCRGQGTEPTRPRGGGVSSGALSLETAPARGALF